MSIMVTGGAGYIGAHVTRLLQERGDRVLVVDDVSTGRASRIGGADLLQLDLAQAGAQQQLRQAMGAHDVRAVIHFAARKQVGESVQQPVFYYQQNLTGLTNLLSAMDEAGVQRLIFSSSAAVYGMPDVELIIEETTPQPINPYGKTKLTGEWLIADVMAASDLRAAALRYFNVAGSGWPDLGDPAVLNLVPMVFDRLERGQAPVIFGEDYPTPDGTCVRDYLHVLDLARAHLDALDYLEHEERAHWIFNVGTGRGASVREVVEAIGEVTGNRLHPVIEGRRPGDPPRLVAASTRIQNTLNWQARYGLGEIIDSAWQAWQKDVESS